MFKRVLSTSSVKRILSLCSIFSLALLLPNASFSAQSRRDLTVITSLFPLQDFARIVGGERIKADLLLPPGAEPHTWEPKPSDVVKISRADIFIYIGRPMEPWVDVLLKSAKNDRLKVVEAIQGLPLLDADYAEAEGTGHPQTHSSRGKLDPHVWLDFSYDLRIVDEIAGAFSEKNPANAPLFRSNAEVFKTRLSALDRKYRQLLSKCRHRQIILGGHSAFAYLAKRYNLQQIALYGVSPNAEPTPKKLTAVIQAARNHGVKFIYFEGLVNPKLAEVLANEAGISTLVLNDGANLTREQRKHKVTFLDLMEGNLENLHKGLECE